MRETLRGALLSVLFCGGLALLAAPATAQGGGGTMECDEEDGTVECDDEITVTDTPLPPDPPPPDPPKPPRPPEDPEPPPDPPKQGPTIGPQTKEDKEADEEHQKQKEKEEQDRKTAECTMWTTSLSALQEYSDLGNCGSFSFSKKKRSTCRDLGQQIENLAAKVATCTQS
ncbi:MAG: hypothetical protein OYL92_10580 [Acidobacteriota bacterium]|nr:hypothetical protein [Acidobacteriota bacterium]MDE3265402.1 hypothetical protein [Acidobacteriota bacterium]